MSKAERSDPSSRAGALAFVREHGVVLESGRGPVPSLADAIAGESIRGNWWSHPRGRVIFRSTRAVRDSPDVLVCRLLGGKVTYVHRRLWPAVVRLADEIGPAGLNAIREEHTRSGVHKIVGVAFPAWVPPAIVKQAEQLSQREARKALGEWATPDRPPRARARAKKTPVIFLPGARRSGQRV